LTTSCEYPHAALCRHNTKETFMFKTILVPVDGSEPSEKALAFALELAASQKADLRFCHVPLRSRASELGARIPISREVLDSQWDDVQRAGRAILDAARYRAEEMGVRAETALRSGSPVDAIAELADRDGVDLIIMGSHGYEGPMRTLVSSTAEAVIRRAPVPVIVVGPRSRWESARVLDDLAAQ
jgi:nucleotide-binding universal stress UspA family protein